MPEPHRTCLGCRRIGPRDRLVRLTAGEREVEPDPDGRRSGRGGWVHPEPACVAALVRRKIALGRPIPPDLAERIAVAVSRRVLERLGALRRSGAIVVGREAIRRLGEAVILCAGPPPAWAGSRETISLRADAEALGAAVGVSRRRAVAIPRARLPSDLARRLQVLSVAG